MTIDPADCPNRVIFAPSPPKAGRFPWSHSIANRTSRSPRLSPSGANAGVFGNPNIFCRQLRQLSVANPIRWTYYGPSPTHFNVTTMMSWCARSKPTGSYTGIVVSNCEGAALCSYWLSSYLRCCWSQKRNHHRESIPALGVSQLYSHLAGPRY